ncbi:MAG TPA: GNAT family N-acetyltransferase [Azospirillaceae bacterium]|nr:GNAT family N-acetyltransferase [Azospirillaceae bacterium]
MEAPVDPSAPVPAGKLLSTITYLEMDAPPARPMRPAPLEKLALLRAEECTVAFYRFLYNTVGEPWLWGFRRRLPDEELRALIQAPSVSIHVAYVRGVPAGYFELDRSEPRTCDISYFGLMPEFIGRRIGPWLLDQAIASAWSEPGMRKLTVNTCTFDHPRAVMTYQKAGFRPVEQEVQYMDDPRVVGVIPRHVAPQHPIVGA